MARGSYAKSEITKKIMETFPNAFLVDGKELRVPMLEDSQEVQIKITLTAAKENVSHGNITSNAAPADYLPWADNVVIQPATATPQQPSQIELDNLEKLLASLA